MVDSLSQRVIGRLAALLLLLGGGLTIVSAVLPASPNVHRLGLLTLGLTAIGVGAGAWFAPWHKWSRATTLWLVPPALAMIATGDWLGGGDPYTFGVFFVVVFAWIGVCHPLWTSTKLAPIAAVAYVAPLLGPGHEPRALASAAVVIPLCVLLGEVLAWAPTQMRRAHEIDARRMAGMARLLEASGKLAHENDPAQAAHIVAEAATVLLEGQGAVVLLIEERTTLAVAGARDWPLSSESARMELEQDREVAVALGKGPVFLPPDRFSEIGGALGFGSVLLLPLAGATHPVGAVAVGFRKVKLELDEFATSLAGTFAAQVALTFERLQATQVLIDASVRDELTGLGNRRFANVMLEELRPGDGVVLLDLDNLKTINDTQGHTAGDEALRAVGAFLGTALRDADSVARYGGDEFLLVLSGAGASAEEAVRRILGDWAARSPVSTFSVGVAVHESGRLPAQTLIRADSALYRAKKAGRNRVGSFETDWTQSGATG